MELTITTKKAADRWVDPLMNYLEEHIFWISRELRGEIIQDMPTLFSYIVDLKAEFLLCNKQYEKPFGFNAEYESNGTATIRVGYSQEQITITEKVNP